MSEPDVNELFARAATVAMVEPDHVKPKNGRKKTETHLPETYKLLPESSDAELGVLASFFLSPKDVGVMCVQKQLTDEAFHYTPHALIFQAQMDLWSAGKQVDIISVCAKLRNRDQLELAGGSAFVTSLYMFLPTASNVEFYIQLVLDKKAQRDAIKLFSELEARGYEDHEDVPAYINAAHHAVTQLAMARQKAPKTVRASVLEFIDEVGRRERGEQIQLFTGLARLDDESPIELGDYVGLSGFTKSGKTALAASIIKCVCKDMNMRAAVFSLEMRTSKWIERMVADVGSIHHRSLRKGKLSEEERTSLRIAAEEISSWKLDIFEDLFECESILATLRTLKIRHPDLMVAVIDYFQLAKRSKLPKGDNREQELAWFSRQIQQASQQLQITIIVLCQLNEKGDARESKSIMQDCTKFWQVVQELDEHGHPKKGSANNRTIWVKLQRSGEQDIRIPVRYFGHYTRFENDPDFVREDQAELPIDDKPKSRPHKRFRKDYED